MQETFVDFESLAQALHESRKYAAASTQRGGYTLLSWGALTQSDQEYLVSQASYLLQHFNIERRVGGSVECGIGSEELGKEATPNSTLQTPNARASAKTLPAVLCLAAGRRDREKAIYRQGVADGMERAMKIQCHYGDPALDNEEGDDDDD